MRMRAISRSDRQLHSRGHVCVDRRCPPLLCRQMGNAGGREAGTARASAVGKRSAGDHDTAAAAADDKAAAPAAPAAPLWARALDDLWSSLRMGLSVYVLNALVAAYVAGSALTVPFTVPRARHGARAQRPDARSSYACATVDEWRGLCFVSE
jgi:hypothetical protein